MRPAAHSSPPPPAASAHVDEFTLADLCTAPDVAAALEQSPELWRSCVASDEATGKLERVSLTRQEFVNYVWLNAEDGTWTIALAEELFPMLDLDNDGDCVLASMRGHADVADAYHEDREVFVFSTTRTLTPTEAAVLTLQALTAGHVQALRSAGLGD